MTGAFCTTWLVPQRLRLQGPNAADRLPELKLSAYVNTLLAEH
jgi:hypothetical protein